MSFNSDFLDRMSVGGDEGKGVLLFSLIFFSLSV